MGRVGSARRLVRRWLAGGRSNAEALAVARGPLRRVADCWGLTPGLGVPHVDVRLRTRDGVVLAASYLPGPAGPRAELPAVVLAPGLAGHRTKPAYALLAERLSAAAAVLALDLRGHGGSGGRSTLGIAEAHDVDAGAEWLRGRGHGWVAAIGASMGATAVLRAAGAPQSRFDAVCALSAPAGWALDQTPAARALTRVATVGWYRAAFGALTHVRLTGVPRAHPARQQSHRWLPPGWVHQPVRGVRNRTHLVGVGAGIACGVRNRTHLAGVGARTPLWRTRLHPRRGGECTSLAVASGSFPEGSVAVVGSIAPVPLLLVHGTDDHIVGAEHARQLYAAAGEPRALWLRSRFGHAEDGLRLAFADGLASAVQTVYATGRWPARPSTPGAVRGPPGLLTSSSVARRLRADTPMSVRVRLFAALREAAGTGEDQLTPGLLPVLLDVMRERHGERFAEVLSISTVLLDGSQVDRDAGIDVPDGAELALLPPVSGGCAAVQRRSRPGGPSCAR